MLNIPRSLIIQYFLYFMSIIETTPENLSKEETNRSEERQELTTVSSEKCSMYFFSRLPSH